MLKTMRNSFHHLKWTLFAMIAVFILGFVFWSGSGTDGDPAGQVVASVGGERITAIEFDRQYRAQLERYKQMYQGNFSPELERALDLPRNVLDAMIERKLRLEAARRLDLSVSDAELAEKIVTLPFFQAGSALPAPNGTGYTVPGRAACADRPSRSHRPANLWWGASDYLR